MTPAPYKPFASVIVCPTWACNFRCWYCYQDHENTWMPEGVVRAMERFLSWNALRTPTLWLDFFGGEPLLCADTVVRLAGHALRESLDNGGRFHSGMTTNAYLLDRPTLHRLYDVGVNHFQVTLDGEPGFHDAQRTLASGRGSWERIWDNLVSVRNSAVRVRVTLRVHFHVGQLAAAARLVEGYINPAFGADERFAVQFEPIRRLGGPDDRRIPVADPAQVLANRLALERMLARPSQNLGIGRGDAECYAAKSHTLVVKPDGELAKCTVSFEPIGRLRADGTLDIHAGKSAEWAERASKCPSCPQSAAAAPRSALSLPVL